jgi:serine/threonine-protein kinase SRK2
MEIPFICIYFVKLSQLIWKDKCGM